MITFLFLFLLKSNLYAGNTCNTATPLPNNMTTFSNFSTSPAGNGAGTPTPSCGNYNGSDIWFATTVGANGELDIVTLAGSMGNAAMAVYTGSCSSLTELACAVSDYCTGTQMPVMQFDGLTPNMPVYIRVWPENGVGGGTFQIRVSAGDPPGGGLPFTIPNGSAMFIGSCIQLTTNATGQVGCAWNPNPISFAVPFEKEFYMNFGSVDANGADGIVLGFQQTAYPHSTSGGSIGTNGLGNSFFIEFDTWLNGQFADIPQDHVAVFTNGDMANPISGPTALNGGNIEDGMDHLIKFVWTPPTSYQVFFDGALVASGSYDMTLSFGASQMAFCGVTATTGGSTNIHTVCPAGPTIYPAGNETVNQVTLCEGETYPLTGQTFNTPGVFGLPPIVSPMPNGCQSVVSTVIEVLGNSTNNTVPPQIVCGDQLPFVFAGQTFNTPGPQSVTLPNANYQMCDSIIEFDLTILNPQAVVFPPTDLITCTNSSVSLNGAALSTSGPDVTYTWTGPTPGNGCFVGPTNTADVVVNCPGQYTLTVVQTVNGVSCPTTSAPVTVGINISTPVADAGAAQTLDCATMTATLNGSNSTPSTVFFSWTGPNGFTSNLPTPVVSEAGTYVLTVVDALTGCISQTPSTVVVTGGASVTAAASANSTVIDCNNTSAILDAAGSSMGTYTWTDDLGTIVGTGQTVSVAIAGTYTLTVDNGSGCQETAQVIITSNNTPPTATITGGNTIDCNNTSTILTANSSMSNLTYSWVDANGMSLGTGTSIVVLEASVVTLMVTDSSTGCSFSPNPVGVVDNSSIISADVSVDGIIDCGGNAVTLTAMNVTGTATPTYTWTNASGNVIGMGATVTVMTEGTYTVLVEDAVSGCETTASGTVVQNLSIPIAMASVSDEINCNNTSVTLDGTGSSTTGGTFIYEWFDASNTLVGTGLMLPVSNGGDYTLFITNTDNGCFQTSNVVTVMENNTPPSATITTSNQIDCNNNSAILSATNITGTTSPTYTWTDAMGNVLGMASTVEVTSAGTYTLLIEDLGTGCEMSIDEMVTGDAATPTAVGIALNDIDCNNTTAILDGTGSSTTGGTFTYEWFDVSNVSVGTSLMTTVSDAGNYTLVVTNTDNNCSVTSNVVSVVGNNNVPTAIITVSNDIDCNNTTATLDGTGSAGIGTLNYSWQDANGIVLGTNPTYVAMAGGDVTLIVTDEGNGCKSMPTVGTVVDNTTTISVIVISSGNISCTNNSVTLEATNIAGINNPTFIWTDENNMQVGTTNPIMVNSAGTYTVEVTAGLGGCTGSGMEVVTGDNTQPLAVPGTNQELNCDIVEVTLNGSNSTSGNNITYEWQDANGTVMGTNAILNNITIPGIYTLVVTNTDNGCFESEAVEVTQNIIEPIAEAGDGGLLSCTASSITLDGAGSSTGMEMEYNWFNANNTNVGTGISINVASSGVYTIVVEDTSNGCMMSDTVTITQDANVPTAIADSDGNLTCIANAVMLDATGSSAGTNIQYQWLNSQSDILGTDIGLSVSDSGTYILVVTDVVNGCSSSTDVLVSENTNPPIADAGMDAQLTCANGQVTLDGSNSSSGGNFQYEWFDANNELVDVGAIITVAAIDTYTLVVTNLDNGCSTFSEAEVTQDANVPMLDVLSNTNTLNCEIESIALDGSNSSAGMTISYQWTDGTNILTTNPILNVTESGDYIFTIIDSSNGCEVSDIVSITQDTIAPNIAIVSDVVTCVNPMITLDGTGSSSGNDFSYVWENTTSIISTDISTEINEGGTYQFTVQNDLNGCSTTQTFMVAENTTTPFADAGVTASLTCGTPTTILNGNNSSTGLNISYEWQNSMGDVLGNEITLEVGVEDTYSLIVTNTDNGCSAISDVIVTQDGNLPTANITAPGDLTCFNWQIVLDGSGSFGSGMLSYQWLDSNGDLLGTNFNQAVTDSGTYTLIITDLSNNCTGQTTYFLDADTDAPTADAGMDATLTCSAAAVELDGSNSETGVLISYQWLDPNGTNAGTTPIINATQSGIYTLTVMNFLTGCSSTETVEVFQDANLPAAVISPTNDITCVQSNAILSGVNSTGIGALTFEWTNNQGQIIGENPTLSVSSGGTYSLQVTDVSNGCSTNTSVTIDSDISLPNADAGMDGILTCENETYILSAANSSQGSGFSYTWEDDAGAMLGTGVSYTADEAGTYILVVSNSSTGCSSESIVMITENITPPISLPTTNDVITCSNNQANITASGSTGGGALTFEWLDVLGNSLGTNETVTVNDDGLYELIVTDGSNGCTASENVLVTENTTSPVPSIEAVTDLNLSCNQNNLVVDGSGSLPLGMISYEWTLNGNIISFAPNPQVDEAGELILTVTDLNNGCSAETLVNITQNNDFPTALIANPTTLTCDITSIELDGSNSSTGTEMEYLWTGPGIILNETSLMPTIDEAGTYTLSVTNTDNGCATTSEIIVLENVTPPMAIATATDELDCNTLVVSLDGTGSSTGNVSYNWTTANGMILSGATILNPQVTQQGTYELVVTSFENGCTATATANVSLSSDAISDAEIEIIDPLCVGDMGTINIGNVTGGSGPYVYSLDFQPFTSSNTFNFLSFGNYTIVIEDAEGCQYSDEVSILQPQDVQVVLPADVRITLGEEYTLEPQLNLPLNLIETIEWTDGDSLSCTDCLNPISTITESSFYTIVVTTTNGCKATASMWIYVEKPRDVFIPNVFSPDGNGTNDVFYIFADETMVKEVKMFRVFTRWGELVYESTDFEPNQIEHGWDGFFKGVKMNPAVFVYLAEIEFIDGVTLIYKGDVTLKR